MTWHHGKDEKRPKECIDLGKWKMKCPNLKELDPTNMEGETYSCEVCGEYIYLDYEEMR